MQQSRRTDIQVFFAGVDITSSLQKYLLSMTYTDNEEDESDDLQIKLQDRDGIWLQQWLNTTVQAAAEQSSEETEIKYMVISATNVVSGTGKDPEIYGTLSCGTIIDVKSINDDNWASIKYSGKSAYVDASCLKEVYIGVDDTTSSGSSATETTSSSGGGWNIGDEVTASGRPQYSSYGDGTPGANVTNYTGTITYLNLKDGVPYPIHVGSLGWFAEDQVTKAGTVTVTTTVSASSETEDDASKGLKIHAYIIRKNWNEEGVDEKLYCGQFELDNVTAAGPPQTVTIKATSLPYNSTVRQTKKSRSWESYTLSGIQNEIVYNNGMDCMFECTSDPSYDRIEQYKASDISFLQKLCQDVGLSLKITNNVIVIFDQATYESKDVIDTITFGKGGGYSSYKLTTNSNDTYTSCCVSYTDDSGQVITGTAYVSDYDESSEDNQCLYVYRKVGSIAEAETLAKNTLRLHNKYEFEATFTLPGNPAYVAGCTIGLSGFGAWDGKYMIKKAKHTVSSSGYKTDLTLRRVLNQ